MSILDNCSAHRSQKCVQRLQARWTSIIPVHTPINAHWLDQIEDLLLHRSTHGHSRPNDFDSLTRPRRLLSPSKISYEKSAAPFRWKFTREDLAKGVALLDFRISG